MDEVEEEPHILNQDDIEELQYMLAMVDVMEKSKIKILCLSLWFPLSMSRYFEKALQHRDDVDLKTCGVYTGQWIPWMGGMNLPQKYAIAPDIPLPFSPSVGQVNYEIVKARLGNWIPDIVLTIDAGIHFKYKPTDGLVVHVATDPHALNYDYQRTISDKFFNMQAVYSKGSDIYLPYAYSKYDFFPEDIPNPDDAVDAVLIGMPYEQRVQWVSELRKRGVSVIFENGPVFDEARELYNRGKIGLNWSSRDDLNCRAFELAAMKICPVMNVVLDMYHFDDDIFGDTFRTLNEAIERVMFLVKYPQISAAKAERAYQAVQLHTYDERVNQILVECGFL